MESLGKSAVAEFVATFGLIFIGAGAVMMAPPGPSGLVAVALAHGLVLAIMVSITVHISGGMVNPAIAISLWVTGKIDTVRLAVCVVAELAGAIVGAVLLRALMPGGVYDAAGGGTPVLATGAGVTAGKGVIIEAVLTFFLAFAVFGTAVDERGPFGKTAGLTIGLVLAFDILAAGPLTGAAMNPARSLGPALVSGTLADWWVYWVGPTAGAIIAGVMYWTVFLRGNEPATP